MEPMRRELEQELMNDFSQVEAYAAADFSAGDASMISRLEGYIYELGKNQEKFNCIVDLGCGPGNITERLALRWPNSRIIGIDGSDPMVRMAKLRKKNNLDNIKGLNYLCIKIGSKVSDLSFISNSVNLIVSNSCLHHFHTPDLFWECIKYLAAPKALVFHRDLRRPSTINNALELTKKYTLDSPNVLKADYLASLKAAFSVNEVRSQLKAANLNHLNVSEIDDRYLEIFGLL